MPDRMLLSIDDEPDVLKLLGTLATDLGYKSETVSSAGSFMTAYARTHPTVITVDICMPVVDGIELLRWLGDVGATARIIIVTGAHPSYGEMAQRLAQAGGISDIHILRKPFRIADIRRLLSTAPEAHPAAEGERLATAAQALSSM
jgi:FixJ family two-component response regulator